MIYYPDCPFCENSNSALSIVDVEINGISLKAICCNNCKKYFGFFQDVKTQIEELKEEIKSLESEVSDLT